MFPGFNSLVMNLILSFLLTVISSQSYTWYPTGVPQVILPAPSILILNRLKMEGKAGWKDSSGTRPDSASQIGLSLLPSASDIECMPNTSSSRV